MDYGLWIMAGSNGLKVKYLDGFVSDKYADFGFTRFQIMDWRAVDSLWIIMVFLSAVCHHSDGTYSLQRIHR